MNLEETERVLAVNLREETAFSYGDIASVIGKLRRKRRLARHRRKTPERNNHRGLNSLKMPQIVIIWPKMPIFEMTFSCFP
jgi:prophage antirepressor-like protein